MLKNVAKNVQQESLQYKTTTLQTFKTTVGRLLWKLWWLSRTRTIYVLVYSIPKDRISIKLELGWFPTFLFGGFSCSRRACLFNGLVQTCVVVRHFAEHSDIHFQSTLNIMVICIEGIYFICMHMTFEEEIVLFDKNGGWSESVFFSGSFLQTNFQGYYKCSSCYSLASDLENLLQYECAAHKKW